MANRRRVAERLMKLRFQHGDRIVTLEAEQEGAGWRVRLPDGSEHAITAARLPDGIPRITDGDRSYRVPLAWVDGSLHLSWQGRQYVFADPKAAHSRAEKTSSSGLLTAPMFGLVTEVLVAEGQSVAAYQPLVVVEAMKVLATIEAPFAGTVAKIHVSKGDRVEHGAAIVEVAEVASGG